MVLAEILTDKWPSLVFLSEIQTYQCDVRNTLQYIQHEYCFAASSEDVLDMELPLLRSKAKGGSMILWRKWLDPYVKVIPPTSSSYIVIILKIPGYITTVHVSLYLPTHGQDTEFVSELASLKNCLDDLSIEYDDPILFIRGDANVNDKNTARVNMLNSFMDHHSLIRTPIQHRTYHHFTGDGKYDSNVDVIIHSSMYRDVNIPPECVTSIICKKSSPALNSHHDVILSLFEIPPCREEKTESIILAPRIPHHQSRVIWSTEGIDEYASLVSSHLKRLRDSWLRPDCQASMSALLELTTTVMVKCAAATNNEKIIGRKMKKTRQRVHPQCQK